MAEPRARQDAAVDGERTIRSPNSGGLSATLGARVHRAGQRLAVAHLTAYGWEPPLRAVLARMTRWQDVNQDRFARTELDLAAAAGQPRHGPTLRADPGHPDPGRAMPADVRSWLREVAGPGAERVRVHVDGEADALARRHDADAVTSGQDTYFRAGRFSVEDPAGRGLLAHEATHVAAAQVASETGTAPGDTPPSAPTRPDAPSGRRPRSTAFGTTTSMPVHDREHTDAEEAGAQALERAVRTGEPKPGVASPPAGALPGVGALAGVGGWFRPDGEATDLRAGPVPAPTPAPTRSVGPGADAAGAPAPSRAPVGRGQPEPPTTLDLAALRRDLVADLMRQLRTEFERGG